MPALPHRLLLGSPVVPFTLVLGYGFRFEVTKPKKGCPHFNVVIGLPSLVRVIFPDAF